MLEFTDLGILRISVLVAQIVHGYHREAVWC